MKRLSLPLFLTTLVLVGAGCSPFGGGAPAVADGGVFKSVNSGADWVQSTVVQSAKGSGTTAGTNVTSLVMDPSDHTVLYMATRENGLLYSLDSGASWQQPRTAALQTGAVNSIAVDKTDTCTVYVAQGARLYKSKDCLRSAESETYVETRTGVTVSQVAVDWYNPAVLYIGLSNGDILKSENAGESWRPILYTKSNPMGILVSNADSRKVIIALDKEGFVITSDSGATWTQIGTKELKDLKKGANVYRIVQDKTGTTLLATSGYGLMKSTDFGTTWSGYTLLTAAGQVAIHAMGLDPNNPNTLYYAAGSTFYSSIDGGQTWDSQKLPTTRTPEALLVDPQDPKILYLAGASAAK